MVPIPTNEKKIEKIRKKKEKNKRKWITHTQIKIPPYVLYLLGICSISLSEMKKAKKASIAHIQRLKKERGL